MPWVTEHLQGSTGPPSAQDPHELQGEVPPEDHFRGPERQGRAYWFRFWLVWSSPKSPAPGCPTHAVGHSVLIQGLGRLSSLPSTAERAWKGNRR